MADHSLPTISSTYSNFVTELDGRFDDLSVGFDPNYATSVTKAPLKTIRWNSTILKWERNNGINVDNPDWQPLSDSYSININGTVGATTRNTGAFTTISTTGAASLGSGSTVNSEAIVTVSASQTLTNKTLTTPVISSISNSGTITLPTGTRTLVALDTADTLSNKTLTAPKFANGGFIADANGNELIKFTTTASAVNELTVTNSATGTAVLLDATGGDTNISLNIRSKGTGTVQVNGAEIATTSTAQTFTNKTLTTPVISSISNSGTITLPTGTDTLVGRATTDTLTNKTLTAPKIADLGFISDPNGNEYVIFDAVASAVNEVTVTNAATGTAPTISSSGGDTNIDLLLVAKGTGVVRADGVEVATISGTQTLTNKTWNSNTIAVAYGGTGATTAVDARTNLGVPATDGTNASGTWSINVTGNAGTVTNGLYSTGSYSNPTWLTGLDASKLSGTIATARLSGDYSGFSHVIDGATTIVATASSGTTDASARVTYNLVQYRSASSAQTGAIVFIAPNTTSDIMYQFEVEGLLYNENIVKFIVQGYRSTAAWADARKINLGTVDVQVRWGVTPDGKNCLIIGDIGTSWSYPHFTVTRASFSHTGASTTYSKGWTAAIVTSLASYTNVTGTISASTFTGSISGNAATVTNGVYTTGDQTIGGTKTFSSTISGSITGNSGTVTNGVYTTGDQTIAGTKTFSSTISGSINGNAGTVTNGVYTTGNQTIGGNKSFSGNLTINGTSGNYSTILTIGTRHLRNVTATNVWEFVNADNTAVITTIDNTGNIVASANVTAYSDERLKKDWGTLPQDFIEKLSQVKYGTYSRIDSNLRQVGVSAQSLQQVIPEGVASGEYLSVAYGNVALVAAIDLSKKVLEQSSRIAILEKLVSDLLNRLP